MFNTKKLLAAGTAVAMLSTMAMATNYNTGSIKWNALVHDGEDMIRPGQSIRFDPTNFTAVTGTSNDISDVQEDDPAIYDFTSEYFRVSTLKYLKGANLVSGTSFAFAEETSVVEVDYNGVLNITLKDDRTLLDVASTNFQIDELVITALKDSRYQSNASAVTGSSDDYLFERGDKFEVTDVNAAAYIVSYYGAVIDDTARSFNVQNTGSGIETVQSSSSVGGSSNIIYTADFSDNNDIGYRDMTMHDTNGMYAFGRIYDNEVFSLSYSGAGTAYGTAATAVKAYDADVEMFFHQIKMTDMASAWTVELSYPEDHFVYEVDGDVLVASDLTWDSDAWAFTGKVTNGTTTFVVSESELYIAEVEVEDETTTTTPNADASVTNPSTGRA